MRIFKNKVAKVLSVIFSSTIILTLLVTVGAEIISYDSDTEAITAYCHPLNYKRVDERGYTSFLAENSSVGFIFYPGGFVDEESYLPLLARLADSGISTFLVPMPLNLAVLGLNRANKVTADHPEITSWYIGGHSLGGAMAASYLSDNSDHFDGLVLLAAYSTVDLSKTDLKILSVIGTEDGVLNVEKYEQCKQNIANNAKEVVIQGGNHAGFGMYGEQKNDGKALVPNAEQIDLTVSLIKDFIFN